MKCQQATSLLVFSTLGLAAAGGLPLDDQTRSGGSEVPCAAPLTWRVARVDAEFGLDVSEATAAVQQAAELWERAVGRRLFTMDPSEGFPVRFVFDERQERTQERVRRESELEQARVQLDVRRGELTLESERLQAEQAAHSARLRDHESRVAAHNAEVRAWNDRGGATPDVEPRLRAEGEALDAARRELEADGRELDRRVRVLRQAQEGLNREVGRYNRLAEELVRDFPATPIESGIYREAIGRENGRVVSVSREIRLYRFDGAAELRLVAAHELGHALGLGHSPEVRAVMNEQHGEGGGAEGVSEIHAADVAMLQARCPELVSARP